MILLKDIMKYYSYSDCLACLTEVMPPDEYAENVNNSVFTNMIATRSLQFAAKVAYMCQLPERVERYSYYADRIYIPFDFSVGYHPEYSGYIIGTIALSLNILGFGFAFLDALC